MKMKVPITQQDINIGKMRNSSNCAIALALKREFAYDMNVLGLVGDLIQIGKDGYQAMPEVIRWVANFDRGRPVKPITLELETRPFFRGENLSSGRSTVDYNMRRGACGGHSRLKH